MYFEEKLDLVLQRLEEQQQLLQLFIPDLRKKRSVALFLGITEQCLGNWLKDSNSPIEEGVHYRFNSHGRLEFIPSAIISLKRDGGYKNRRIGIKNIKADQMLPAATNSINNLITQKILQKIGKISMREEAPEGDVL